MVHLNITIGNRPIEGLEIKLANKAFGSVIFETLLACGRTPLKDGK